MPTVLDDIDRQRLFKRAEELPTAPEAVCRISLSSEATRPLELKWCGGPRQRETILMVHPGKSVDQPLGRARSWFGPFDMPAMYEVMPDGPKREHMRDTIATEITRFVMRYDWDHGDGRGLNPNMQKTGHNRAPDVTIQKLDPNGEHTEPVRIHELYKIGEFDPEKEGFHRKKSASDLEAEYKAQLDERDREVREMRLQLAELSGKFTGAVAGAVSAQRAQGSVAKSK